MKQLKADNNDRIIWIDVFKGIMIILVVLGHATGKFNQWIYQFHMVAFFFVSGYLSSLRKKNGVLKFCSAFINLMFPFLFISIVSFFCNYIIDRLGLFHYLFGNDFIGVADSILEMLLRGNVYSQYLGTFWFLTALFGAEFFQIIVMELCHKKINIYYVLITLIAYFIGVYLAYTKMNCRVLFLNIPIILISQFYFALGLIIQETSFSKIVLASNYLAYCLCFVGAVIISFWGIQNGVSMDLASSCVTHPFASIFVAISSIFIVVCVSKMVSHSWISKYLRFIGENSIGIMVFHFIIFKIMFVIYNKLGYLEFDEVSNVVLPSDSSIKLWLPLVIVSVFMSLLIWNVVKIIPVVNILIGQNKRCNKKIIDSLSGYIIGKWSGTNTSKDCNISSKKNQLLVLGIVILVILITLPWVGIGIIVNDELQARCLSLTGFSNFYKENFLSYLYDGRPLAAIVNSFTMYIGFIGNGDTYVFKTIQVIVLCAESMAFSCFVKKITNDRVVSVLSGVLSFGFLPIVFEHMEPNAFVGLLGIPFLLLLISLVLYKDCVDQKDYKRLVASMALFFVAQMSYETFITYTLLYLIIILVHSDFKLSKDNRAFLIGPILTATLYLSVYVICGKIFSSSYSGNQVYFQSIESSLQIIGWLFLVCIPGFFLVFPRYQYFEKLYFSMSLSDWVWLIVVSSLFAVVLWGIFRLEPNDGGAEKPQRSNGFIIFGSLLYMILPSLPLSISRMYQGNVGIHGFLCLPITHFEYFSAVLLISYLSIISIRRIRGHFYIIVTLCFILLFSNIQLMNSVISKEQTSNYERFRAIEEFIQTARFRDYNQKAFYAPDLYLQQNALAIHDGYWTKYCQDYLGLSIQLFKDNQNDIEGYIFYDGDNFVVVNNDTIDVFSQDIETSIKAIRISDDDYILFDFQTYELDNGFYRYSVKNDMGDQFYKVGYRNISGMYEDGWLMKESEFEVFTGDKGMISLSIYYPDEITNDMEICIYLNGIEYIKKGLVENSTSFIIECEKDTKQSLLIKTNFEVLNKNTDLRELSIMLSNMNVE